MFNKIRKNECNGVHILTKNNLRSDAIIRYNYIEKNLEDGINCEGEENFTITKEHLENTLENLPEIKDKVEIFVDWDEDNFEKSMANSDILLAWDFPTKNLKKISPNLKWIHVVSAGVEHLLPLDWMFDDLVLTNSSGAHAKKAGEYGLMAVLMLQNHMTKIVTNQKNKEFISLLNHPPI